MLKNTIFILSFLIISSGIYSQNYKITEEKEKYGIVDNAGEIIFPEKYTWIYSCKYAPGYFIAEGKDQRFYLLNPKHKKVIEINEYDHELELDNESLIQKGKILRFKEKGKIGLLKFPDSVFLNAEYKMIYPFQNFKDVYLLENKKQFKILNLKNNFKSEWFKPYYSYESLYIDDGYSFIQTEEYFIAEFEDGFKLINLEGNEYNLPKVNQGEYYLEETDLLLAYKDGKYGFINYYGEISIPFKYEDAGPPSYSSGIMYIKRGNKYGYIDYNDNIVIPCIYDKAGPFIDGYAKVGINGIEFTIDEFGDREDWLEPVPENIETDNDNLKYGYINADEEVIIDFIYDDAKSFSKGFAPVKKDGKWAYISQAGTVLIDFKFDDAREFYSNLALCQLNKKWGYIDFSGEFVIDPQFDYAYDFIYSGSFTKVGKNINGELKYSCIDREGNLKFDYIFADIGDYSESKFAVKQNNLWGYINEEGILIIDYKFKEAKKFLSGLAAVKKDKKWAFINPDGELVIEYLYDDALNFYNQIAPVKIGDKWGYINTKGEMIIKPQYDDAGYFYYKTANVKKDGKRFNINKKGEIVK